MRVRVNVSIKCRDTHFERKISEIIKKYDSMNHLEECVQYKHGEK